MLLAVVGMAFNVCSAAAAALAMLLMPSPSWCLCAVDECNKALAAALRSKASAAGGEKEFIMPLQPGGLSKPGQCNTPQGGSHVLSVGRGQACVVWPQGCCWQSRVSMVVQQRPRCSFKLEFEFI